MSFFGEQIIPGVVSQVDAAGLAQQGQLAYGAIGIVGLSSAGEEDVVHYFTSSSEATRKLRGGALLSAILAAYRTGARRVYAVRVGTPVASSKQFAASANADSVTITALDKGTFGDNIEVAIAEGTGGAGTRTYTFRRIVGSEQILETFDNGDGSGYTTKVLAKAAVNASSVLVSFDHDVTVDQPDVTVGYVPLASGSDGTRTTNEVSDGFDLLLNQPVDICILDTDDDTYHAIVLGHCEEASNSVNRSERTCVVGLANTGANPASVSEYTDAATAINSKRGCIVAPNVYGPQFGIDVTSSTLQDGYITAAEIAGLKAGLSDPAEPATFKLIPGVTGLNASYTQSQLEQLITGKVIPLALHRRGYRLVKQVTCSADSEWEEWSVVTSVDYIMKDLRAYLDELYIGRKGTSSILALIEASVRGRLNLYFTQEIIYGYFADSVIAQFLPGDQTFVVVSFQAVPIFPVNNIGISATLQSAYNFNLALQLRAA